MDKRTASFIFFLLALFTFSCRDKNNGKKSDNTIDLNIKPILIAQIMAGKDQTYGSFDDYSEKDLNALVLIEDTILKNSGYKKPDVRLFNKRIEEIFGRVIDQHSKTSYLKIDTYKDSICNKKLTFYPYTADAQYLYIAKNKQFITHFYPIPLVLDYLKAYPELAEYEKKDIEIYDAVEKIKTRASQWKDDVKNLSSQRQLNVQELVNRNKYLFNNDKASLDWLIKHDLDFLSFLVKSFGYDKETKVNKAVLEDFYKSSTKKEPTREQTIGELFFVKDCNDKLQIREGLLRYVETNTSAIDNRLLYALSSYVSALFDDNESNIFEEHPSKKFSLLEKAKIAAYFAHIENPAINKYKSYESSKLWNNPASSLYNLSVAHPEVIKLIEKNGYFGLADLKGIIEKLQEEASSATQG